MKVWQVYKDGTFYLFIYFIFFQHLADINKWGADIIKIAEFSDNRPLTCITYKIFQVGHFKKTIMT